MRSQTMYRHGSIAAVRFSAVNRFKLGGLRALMLMLTFMVMSVGSGACQGLFTPDPDRGVPPATEVDQGSLIAIITAQTAPAGAGASLTGTSRITVNIPTPFGLMRLDNFLVTITSTAPAMGGADAEGAILATAQTTYNFGVLGQFATSDAFRLLPVRGAPGIFTVTNANKTIVYGPGTGIFRTATGAINTGRGFGAMSLGAAGSSLQLDEEGVILNVDYSAVRL